MFESNECNAFRQPFLCHVQNKWLGITCLKCWCSDKQMFSHQHAFQVIAKYHLEFTIFWLYSSLALKWYSNKWIDLTCYMMYNSGIMVPPPMYNYKFIVKSIWREIDKEWAREREIIKLENILILCLVILHRLQTNDRSRKVSFHNSVSVTSKAIPFKNELLLPSTYHFCKHSKSKRLLFIFLHKF